MRNTFVLIKNYFICGLGSLLGKKKQRTKNFAGLGLGFLLIVGFMVLFGFSAWTIGYAATQPDAAAEGYVLEMLLYQGFSMAAVLVVAMSLQKVTGGQRASDTDLLMSMPFTKIQIVVAKAVSRYLFNLGIAFVFAFPYIFMYLYFAGFSLAILLTSLVVLLLVPFLAIGFCYIIDFITVILFRRAVFGSIMKSLFTLAIIALLVIIMSTNSYAVGGPIGWMLEFVLYLDLTALLYLAILTILPAIVGLWLFSITLTKQNQVTRGKQVDINGQHNRGVLSSIFRKEFNKYINTPIYIINTIIGPIMLIGLTAWILIDGGNAIASIASGFGLPASLSTYILVIIFSMISAFTIVSASAISLEGKNLWILKTMPLDTRTVLFGKVLLNLVLFIPILLICCIALFFAIEMTIVQLLLIIALPLLVNIIISFGGLFINLLFPKLEWDSEASVVKQSLAVTLTMLIGFAIAFLPIILALIFDIAIANFETIILISLGIYAVLAVASVILAMTKGKTLYEKL